MPKFKSGDRVRVKDTAGFSRGSKGSITDIDGTAYLVLRDGAGSGLYFAETELELIVEKPKPWLKVTPPQPEKRELQSCWLNSETNIIVNYGSVKIETSWLDKGLVRELGETLIEISKEMK